jgi:hypothetical protein
MQRPPRAAHFTDWERELEKLLAELESKNPEAAR